MKLASFLLVSMALHAAALASQALFLELRAVSPVMVTIIDAHGKGAGGAGSEEGPLEKKPAVSARKSAPIKRRPLSVAGPEQVAEPSKAISAPVVASEISSATAILADSTEHSGPVESYLLSNGVSSSGIGGADAGGMGETVGSGSGRGGLGKGSGDRYGNGNSASTFVQPRYDYCPNPDHPQSATREAREGKVVLRVLVDPEGKPKSVEVYRSSGFAILDQAAVDNVKRRCRFHPARDGEKRVEQWTRVPVEFAVRSLRN
jgi:TonB family protein